MLNILVVDDSLIMRRNIIKMIESLGHKVVGEAKDGQEGVEFYRKLKPDLVTMDITMPRMDGLGAVKELKRVDKNAKIIMVTSHGQEEMVIDAIRSGASGYLLKPMKINKLSDAIRKIFPSIIDDTASVQKETVLLESEEITLPEIDDLA